MGSWGFSAVLTCKRRDGSRGESLVRIFAPVFGSIQPARTFFSMGADWYSQKAPVSICRN